MGDNILVFEIFRGSEKLRTDRIQQNVVKIGNLPSSHLKLNDPSVSGIHAVIEVEEGEIQLIDLGSASGTKVNGKKITKCLIKPQDEIDIGELRIIFRIEDRNLSPHAARSLFAENRSGRPGFKFLQIFHRPSDEAHYARRFLSQPSRTDETVEVAHLWRDHIMDETALDNRCFSFFIGPHKSNDIILEDDSIKADRFPLVRRIGPERNAYLKLAPEMSGQVYVDETLYSIEEALEKGNDDGLLITENTRAKLQFGESTLYIHRATRPLLEQIPFELNRSLGLFLLVSLLFHSLLMILVYLTPPESRHFNIDDYIMEQRRITMLLEEEEEEAVEELGDIGDEEEEQEEDPGLEEEEEEDRRMALEGPDDQESQMDELQAREEAMERGALSVLNQMTGPQNLFGGRPIGMDDVMAFGNADGTIIGNTRGGMGLASLGSAGSGDSDGIGIGRISTAGRFGEDGDADLGRDLTRMRERVERDVEVSLGSPSVQGHLDREIIQRVIGRHRREIRDCYQRELQTSPDLEGRVVVNFVIDPAGNVADASIGESDLNNDEVESCMTSRVRRWIFPTPTTPGIVRVSYPFVFTSG